MYLLRVLSTYPENGKLPELKSGLLFNDIIAYRYAVAMFDQRDVTHVWLVAATTNLQMHNANDSALLLGS